MRKNKNKELMTAGEHLRELKNRLLCVIVFFLLSFIGICVFAKDLISFILEIGTNAGFTFVYISPQEILIQEIKLAGTIAVFLSVPIILYELVAFISPIFSSKVRYRIAIFFFCISLVFLMLLGMYFCYKILLPFTYTFLFGLGKGLNIQSAVSLEKYVSLYLTLLLCIGAIFELPLICVFLTKLHLITAKGMRKFQRLAIVISFVFAMIITPPDVVSQIMVAVPIVVLYYVSIFLCSLVEKGDAKHGQEYKNDTK